MVLNELIDKYENSKLSKQGSRRNISISIKSNHQVLANYWAEDSYLFKDQITMSMNRLEKMNYVRVKKNRDDEIEMISLCLDSVSDVYRFINRNNPDEQRSKYIDYLKSYQTKNLVIEKFITKMIERLTSYQSVQSYFENLENLEIYIKAIESMSLIEEETLIRNFSKMVFNDSKQFEKIENKVTKIIRDFANENFENQDEILSSYNLIKTPTFIYIKGGLIIKVNNQIIDLSDYGHEIALSSNALVDFEVISVTVQKVVTIENLTTFVAFGNKDYIAIYLGGFHNTVKRDLITKINNFNPTLEFYHFGDIDAGGLMILEDLVLKTTIEFKPYLMNEEILRKYQSNWMVITETDKKRLSKMIDGRFSSLIKFMIRNNCKLEQEAIQATDYV